MTKITKKPRILSPAEREEIKKAKEAGVPTKVLQERYGVAERTIQRAAYGRAPEKRSNAPSLVVEEVTDASATVPAPLEAAPERAKRPDYSVPNKTQKCKKPKLPDVQSLVRESEIIPVKGKFQNQTLQNGAILVFRKDGSLFRVVGCAIYGNRHSSWLYGTVQVERVENKQIHAFVDQWDGEKIRGQLVFDGTKNNISNCYFYAEDLPSKTKEREEEIRDRLAVVIRKQLEKA